MPENGQMFGRAPADSPLPAADSSPATRGRLELLGWLGWFCQSWCVQGGEAKEEMRNRESRAMSGRRRRKRKERELGGRVPRLLPPLSLFFLIQLNHKTVVYCIINQIPNI